MQTRMKQNVTSKFPLRLMASIRKSAELFSAKEGVSLNQFINVAVAEKLAHLEHQEWLARRVRVTDASIAEALKILDKSGTRHPIPGDELPAGYKSLVSDSDRGAQKKHSKRKKRNSKLS